jgi:hypothetical protein
MQLPPMTQPATMTAWQVPAWQAPAVQASPSASAHEIPFITFVEAQPVAGSQVFAVHSLLSLQLVGAPPAQAPDWQESPDVQASPSLQVEPFGFAGLLHMPVAGLHVPALLQLPAATQITGFAPAHAPPWQVSVCVHASPSLHTVPFGSGTPATQASVASSQVGSAPHCVASPQLRGPPP